MGWLQLASLVKVTFEQILRSEEASHVDAWGKHCRQREQARRH